MGYFSRQLTQERADRATPSTPKELKLTGATTRSTRVPVGSRMVDSCTRGACFGLRLTISLEPLYAKYDGENITRKHPLEELLRHPCNCRNQVRRWCL